MRTGQHMSIHSKWNEWTWHWAAMLLYCSVEKEMSHVLVLLQPITFTSFQWIWCPVFIFL